jgi:imidazolonepropionase-like amidohydrolase
VTRLALVGGRVWAGGPDGARNGAVDADVLVEDDRVIAIGTGLAIGDARVIDVVGATVLPGLVDAHVHLSFAGADPNPTGTAGLTARAAGHLVSYLRAGVTAVRDNGGHDGVVVAVRNAVQRGWLEGPTVLTANQYVSATGGHGAPRWGECGCRHPLAGFAADGPDELRKAVRYQVGAGADHIKVTLNSGRDRVELTEAEMLALVEEAHRMGKRVAVHASIPDAVELAVACGADTIEHGNGATRSTLQMMAARGTVLVPTAHAFRTGLERAMASVAGGGADDSTLGLLRSWRRRVDDHVETLRVAHELGVMIATGTDVFGDEPVAPIADEVAALVDLGLSPAEALQAATAGGGAALGRPGAGLLAEGGIADLVVVPGRPEVDPDSLRRPLVVLRAGRVQVGP